MDGRDRERLRAAAAAFLPDVAAVSQDVSRGILDAHPGLVPPDDPDAVATVPRATLANVEAIVGTLAYGVEPRTLDVPPGALDILDVVARDGDALTSMLRAYRLGAAGFTQRWLAHLGAFAQDRDELDRLARASVAHVDAYVDHLSEVITERWRDVVRAAAADEHRRERALRAALAGEPFAPEDLRHPFARPQLLVAHAGPGWAALLPRLRAAAGAQDVLALALDGERRLAWLAPPRDAGAADVRAVVAVPAAPGWCVVALVGAGADALGTAAEDARAALHALGRLRPDGGSAAAEDLVLPAALLADEARAARVVRAVLGALAERTERADLLCATLRAYLDAAERKSSAAAALGVHEKTVAYRLRQAEEALGRPIAERRAELAAALQVRDALLARDALEG